jgi:hypothetical protein
LRELGYRLPEEGIEVKEVLKFALHLITMANDFDPFNSRQQASLFALKFLERGAAVAKRCLCSATLFVVEEGEPVSSIPGPVVASVAGFLAPCRTHAEHNYRFQLCAPGEPPEGNQA